MSKQTALVFHNGSNYSYHFLIKKIRKKDFEGEFNSLEKMLKNAKLFQFQKQKRLKELGKWRRNYKNNKLQITIH